MTLVSCIILGLLVGSLAAQEGCPTTADLASRVLVLYKDGTRSLARDAGRPGFFLSETRMADGTVVRSEIAPGHWVLWNEGVLGGPNAGFEFRVDYDYGLAPEALPTPEPEAQVRLSVA